MALEVSNGGGDLKNEILGLRKEVRRRVCVELFMRYVGCRAVEVNCRNDKSSAKR